MKVIVMIHTGGHAKVSISITTEALISWELYPTRATCVKCQMLISQTLMNAVMQLFSVSHCALELRISVLIGLGHTSVPAPLALS